MRVIIPQESNGCKGPNARKTGERAVVLPEGASNVPEVAGLTKEEIAGLRAQVGEAIRRARKDADLSQAKVGQHVGKDETTIHRIEAGLNDPQFSTIVGIAALLGVALDPLIEPYRVKTMLRRANFDASATIVRPPVSLDGPKQLGRDALVAADVLAQEMRHDRESLTKALAEIESRLQALEAAGKPHRRRQSRRAADQG